MADCKRCGKRIEEDVQYCESCRKILKGEISKEERYLDDLLLKMKKIDDPLEIALSSKEDTFPELEDPAGEEVETMEGIPLAAFPESEKPSPIPFPESEEPADEERENPEESGREELEDVHYIENLQEVTEEEPEEFDDLEWGKEMEPVKMEDIDALDLKELEDSGELEELEDFSFQEGDIEEEIQEGLSHIKPEKWGKSKLGREKRKEEEASALTEEIIEEQPEDMDSISMDLLLPPEDEKQEHQNLEIEVPETGLVEEETVNLENESLGADNSPAMEDHAEDTELSLDDLMESDDEENLDLSSMIGEMNTDKDEAEQGDSFEENEDMGDILNLLDMEEDGSDQDVFALDENNVPEEDVFALDDKGKAADPEEENDIFSLDNIEEGMEPPLENPDPDNVFAESLGAVSYEEGSQDAVLEQMLPDSEKKEEKPGKEKKKGFFARIFGNIVDKKSKKQFEKEQEEEEAAEFKRSEKQRIKEGRLTEEEKAAEAAKEEEENKKKEEKTAAKEAKKKQAEEKKAEKEAKKKEKREALEAEAAKEMDEGRINRAGAGIIFVFFGAIAAGIIIGTNLFSYSQSISKATQYFDVQKYNNAYEEVSGLSIKEKDETIYNKIMTVMYVNKELNSYNNFYAIEMYPEALDSLLKGLARYDKYKKDAESLGIESDLNYVRRQILGELKSSFSVSEKEAATLNEMEDQEAYSQLIKDKAVLVK